MPMSTTMRILVAEDDEISAHVLVRLLKALGHEPTWVRDGQEALAVMVADPHPVVISDWMMPGTDGISLCQSIRETRPSFYVYFILHTAKIPQSRGSDVLAHGVDAFLAKPIDRKALQAKLNVARSILEGSQMRQVG